MTATKRVAEKEKRTAGPKKKKRANGITAGKLYPFEIDAPDSTKKGQFALEWLLKPMIKEDFFSQVFEKEPKLIHSDKTKFTSLISLNDMKQAVCLGKLVYGVDVDVTRYSKEEGRSTHNLATGTNAGAEAWEQFTTGASLRFLRPQLQSEAIYRLCAHIEGFLECVTGANVYLTPVNSQGFAPHFDDIDAFICQVEGQKRWKVYAPRSDGLDDLPRCSSIDFSREDMAKTTVVIDAVLKPGDMLYLPRGTIHEAECVSSNSRDVNGDSKAEDEYSLHVTVSMFQRWTWADLLAESVTTAVRSAATQDRVLRKTLPLRFGQFAGAQRTDANTSQREWFHRKVAAMAQRVAKVYPTDAAADVLMQRFMRERLPPVLNSVQHMSQDDAQKITKTSIVCAVCEGAARIVLNGQGDTEGLPRIVSCVGNRRSREPVDSDEASLSCLPEEANAVDAILKAYPEGLRVDDVPLDSVKDRIDLVLALKDMGIVSKV